MRSIIRSWTKRKNGERGNAWGLEINPDPRARGYAFMLIGCPIADFAKSHGDLRPMPRLSASDEALAKLMHARLARAHTVALGADSCDYWFIGDKSPEI